MTRTEMTKTEPPPIPVALVYWGRRGAGATLMEHIAEPFARDPRFALSLSSSRQSETPIDALAGARVFPVDTFSGPASMLIRTLGAPCAIRRLVRALSQAGIRAIVTIMPHFWGLALQRAARRAGIRTLLMIHDAEPHPGERRLIFDWLARQEISGSDRIVTLSDHVASRLVARGDVGPERLTRLFLPILTFSARTGREAATAQPFRLLFFGRILPYKGVPMLLDAFARLRRADVDCVLRVVGRGRIAASPALRDQPGLTIDEGWVAPDAIGDILASADAIALPYLEASQSGVIVAAYGAGVPVITTPVGGLAEQVIDGETGILARSVTPEGLADAIRRLIETPGLYETCRAGVARYAERHSAARFAAALGDAVLDTLAAPPR